MEGTGDMAEKIKPELLQFLQVLKLLPAVPQLLSYLPDAELCLLFN